MAKKIRIIINGVSFYTTKKQIIEGVGSDTRINYACSHIYHKCIDEKLAGLGFTYYGESLNTKYHIQINVK